MVLAACSSERREYVNPTPISVREAAAFDGSVLLSVLLVRRSLPDGTGRESVTKVLLELMRAVCGNSAVTSSRAIDVKFPARWLRGSRDIGCYYTPPDDRPVSEECTLGASELNDRDKEHLRALLSGRVVTPDGAHRTEVAAELVGAVRSLCAAPLFPEQCLDEVWNPDYVASGWPVGCWPTPIFLGPRRYNFL